MASSKQLQKLIRLYRMKTGETELDMKKVGQFAVDQGVDLPTPPSPEELLERQLARAAREELGKSEATGRPFREYQALPIKSGSQLSFVYVSIQDATRPQMDRSLNRRREGIVDEVVMLTNDADHWNEINPKAEPLQPELDFGFDVTLRRAAEEPDEEAA